MVNDPTIRRCINFAKAWGAQCVSIASRRKTTICACALRRLEVVNLFAYRTSQPALLKQAVEPIGKNNNYYILESVRRSNHVILAWGNHGSWQKQDFRTYALTKNHCHGC